MFLWNRALRVIGLALVGVSLVLGGCGGSERASAPQTVTADERSVAPQKGSGASGSSDSVRVPNVVGKDHQLAQDTMQAAGLSNLAEEDATGQGRALLVDRHWTVVSQSPKAGTQVDEDQTITLRSKKDHE
jgi:hypothetical protein